MTEQISQILYRRLECISRGLKILDNLKRPFMNINLGGNSRWAPLFVSRQR